MSCICSPDRPKYCVKYPETEVYPQSILVDSTSLYELNEQVALLPVASDEALIDTEEIVGAEGVVKYLLAIK